MPEQNIARSFFSKNSFIAKLQTVLNFSCQGVNMSHSHYHVNNFDACKLSTSWAGTKNTFLKMSLRNARVSFEYLYENVTNDTAELRKLSRMPKTTFYKKN